MAELFRQPHDSFSFNHLQIHSQCTALSLTSSAVSLSRVLVCVPTSDLMGTMSFLDTLVWILSPNLPYLSKPKRRKSFCKDDRHNSVREPTCCFHFSKSKMDLSQTTPKYHKNSCLIHFIELLGKKYDLCLGMFALWHTFKLLNKELICRQCNIHKTCKFCYLSLVE